MRKIVWDNPREDELKETTNSKTRGGGCAQQGVSTTAKRMEGLDLGEGADL